MAYQETDPDGELEEAKAVSLESLGGTYVRDPSSDPTTLAERAVYKAQAALKAAEDNRKLAKESQVITQMLERNPDLRALLITMATKKGFR